jgi:FAD/FMN-containing dehydrogenase
VTGVLAASVVAALGLYLIPAKRRRARNELHAKVNDLRGRLGEAITAQFERELEGSLGRIRSAIRPYTRFVEAQSVAITEAETSLLEVQRALQEIAGRIEAI